MDGAITDAERGRVESTNSFQALVREFHEAMGHPAPDSYIELTQEEATFRANLIAEEAAELMVALFDGDEIGIIDGMADLIYVVLGTAVVKGFSIAPAFEEVHRSNMTKDAIPGLAKPAKGERYEEPELIPILLNQGWRPEGLHVISVA